MNGYLKQLTITIISLCIPILFIYFDANNKHKEITIAAGGTGGAYYQTALTYKKKLLDYGVNTKIINTNGSLEIQELLIKGLADFGFIQGGTEIQNENIAPLANIAVEAVWIFHTLSGISDISDLKGKKIAIGPEGSGILPVATKLLKSVGAFNSSELFMVSNLKAKKMLMSGGVEAMFYVAGEKSNLVHELMREDSINLLELPRAGMYKNFFLKDNDLFNTTTITAGSFDLQRHIPKNNITFLTKNTILSTNKFVSNDLIRLILKVADDTHNKDMLFSDASMFPNNNSMKFPMHGESKEYFIQKETFLEKNFEYWIARSVDNLYSLGILYLLPVISIISFLFGVVFPAMLYLSRKKIIGWFERINKIDSNIVGLKKSQYKLKLKKIDALLGEVRNFDNISPTHMDEFYSLQSHIVMVRREILALLEKEG